MAVKGENIEVNYQAASPDEVNWFVNLLVNAEAPKRSLTSKVYSAVGGSTIFAITVATGN